MKKLVVIGDSFFSSFAHLTRLLRLFELCKQIDSIQLETHLFAYEGEIIGEQITQLIASAVAKGTVDKVITIHPLENEGFYDLNQAKTFIHYTRKHKHVLRNELEQKAAHIRQVADTLDRVIVIHSPGYFGAWYVPPLVPDNVRNVFVIDTVFHPNSAITFGMAWNASTWKGRIQNFILNLAFYTPFRKTVNSIRAELHVPVSLSRSAMYQNYPIIDPNTPTYMQLKHPTQASNSSIQLKHPTQASNSSIQLKHHWQIGPLLPSVTLNETKLKELSVFKGSSPLIYLTLGGSAKNLQFSDFISKVVFALLRLTGGKAKFIITTGLTVSPDDVNKKLGKHHTSCMVQNYYNAQVATAVADVAIGVMGHGHILCAAKNRCPLVVLPVNADQVTHANLVQKLKLGESPLKISFFEMFSSETLIKKVLASAKLLADTAFLVMRNPEKYGNSALVAELHQYNHQFQLNALDELIHELVNT